jgi:AraC-like DNA-binding protein
LPATQQSQNCQLAFRSDVLVSSRSCNPCVADCHHAPSAVLEYILTHLNENITNDALAQVTGLSVCHFARMFKQTVGISPHRYVLQCRVEWARELLASTHMPLSEIAIVTGFSDQSHYTRWFREIVGVTPSSYRWSTR